MYGRTSLRSRSCSCLLTSTLIFQHWIWMSYPSLQSPLIPSLAQLMPSRSLQLKIMLKLPTQTQKPAHVCCVIHKDKVLNSYIESEDNNNDEPHGGDGKRPLITCQAVLVSIIGLSHISLGVSLYSQDMAHLGF